MEHSIYKKLIVKIYSGQSIFLTGAGGVGKTHLINKFYNEYHSIYEIGKTSLTGISALLIGGSTLHSYLGIKLAKESAYELARNIKRKRYLLKRWQMLNILIIDEVSMMSADLFDKIEEIARIVRCKDLPFGGIQLLLSGDFCQLPCVKEDSFCFESKKWPLCINHTFYLTKNYRQDDPHFQKILDEIRINSPSKDTLEVLHSLNSKSVPTSGIIPTILYPLNHHVDSYNNNQLDKIDHDFYEYEYILKIKDSTLSQSKIKDFCKKIGQDSLQLTIGAQVMFTVNLSDTLVNGSRGVVVGFKNDLPQVKIITDEIITVNYYTYKYEENDKILLTLDKLPLKLAWALTIHKCQGATLDCVYVDLSNIFEYGQLYIALSRVKTLKGLYLRGFSRDKIMTHSKVLQFYKDL